ncbi:hypothetical protein GW17_00013791 [Ensete ventricosum]|nr:hypothetical protein GW17_00013791 [Ensete ventricosum]
MDRQLTKKKRHPVEERQKRGVSCLKYQLFEWAVRQTSWRWGELDLEGCGGECRTGVGILSIRLISTTLPPLNLDPSQLSRARPAGANGVHQYWRDSRFKIRPG